MLAQDKPMRKLNVERDVLDISLVEENITESLHCFNPDNTRVCVRAPVRMCI